MNSRNKLLNVFNFNTSSPVPDWEFAYWYNTIQRWYDEGLPKINPPVMVETVQWISGDICPGYDFFGSDNSYGNDVHDFFNFDERIHVVGVNTGPIPAFDVQVYEEDMENIVYRREDGKTVKTRKDGVSMPHFIDFPVKTDEDFEKIKEKFNPHSPMRFAAELSKYAEVYKNRSYPLQLGGGNFAGFFSAVRELMGVEETSYAFYDNPELIIKILEHFTNLYIELYSKVLKVIDVDFILMWEDMAFKNGPLISPQLFKEFCLPYYKKFIGEMKKFGVKHFIVDTDGNFEVLIPLFLEAGVTGFYPFEVAAGMDIEKVRNSYHELIIIGGIDKRSLAEGKDEIDVEISKAARMLEKGGYLPCTDHGVQPEVSFENYIYFRKRLKEILK